MSDRVHIGVVGPDAVGREAAIRALRSAGFSEVDGHPHLDHDDVLPTVLVVVGAEMLQWLRDARQNANLAAHPMLMACAAGSEAERALLAGADEILWPHDSPEAIRLRVLQVERRSQDRRDAQQVALNQNALLEMRAWVADRGDGSDVLRDVLLMAADRMGFERANLIAHMEPSLAAYVLAATDDPTLSRFELSIQDYPEVRQAIRSGSPLLIGDVLQHEVTKGLGPTLVKRGVRAAAVFPVTWKGRSMGVVLFRKGTVGIEHLGPAQSAFGVLLAGQLGAQLRDSRLFDHLRDQTRRLSRVGYEAERRVRTIESLKEHFDASAEGILVIDERGKVLYANSCIAAMTGFAADGLEGLEFADVVADELRLVAQEIVETVLDGANIEAIDLGLKTTTGTEMAVSVTTSTVLSAHGAVVLSLRDVTHQRSLEAQLRHSNDFLENLIDSAVDAIIAADMRGRVILFNKGAEDIYGYRAEDVIGKMSVAKLYPEGVARHVMKMLRSDMAGGPGRLEQIRRELLTKGGELVPVNMTASVIFSEGREVATVGIFSDLRERIRIEQRLLQAQEQIEQQQRLAMVAELAGAAAHELNQPLTSIIGYTQLIERASESNEQVGRYASTIISESERMAEIVKKIGRITHYETVEYVGSASIMDLDRSAAASGEIVMPTTASSEENTARVSLEELARDALDEATVESEELQLDKMPFSKGEG